MARPAPGVERTVAVLNHLAGHPERGFTLSELSRELGLNKATAHALLNSLVETGYLVRDDAAKIYTLGPALIAIGNAASMGSPAARLAVPQMAAVSAELDLECVSSTVVGDEIVILSRSGTPQPLGINAQPGHRLPFVPPLGTIFVAWSGEAEIERWLNRLDREPGPDGFEGYRRTLEAVRTLGYSVGLGHAVHQGAQGYVLTDFAQESYVVHHVGAPVFGADGTVVLGLFLIGFPGQTPASEVLRYGQRLCEATGRISRALSAGP